MSRRWIFPMIVLAACCAGTLALALVAVPATSSRAQGVAPAAELPARAQTVTPPPAPGLPFSQIPYYAEWASSPHAAHAALAFNHWNDEGTIPVSCAKCHSTPGFQDFLGADGSAPGTVDHPAPIGTVITCNACHNDSAALLSSVTFPSGLAVGNLGPSARCMACHQGVESTKSVTAAVAGMPDDTVQPKLAFIDGHYTAAAAVMMGTLAQGAYQYPGEHYAGRLVHPAPYTACTSCHETHTVMVKVEDCAACHAGVTDMAALRTIRMTVADYDGRGNANEGMAQEVDNLEGKLLAAIQAYARTVARTPIVYDGESYPYFFVDKNGNGKVDKGEAIFPNRYNAWTPRLLKAAYNYMLLVKEPGAYAHNPVYTVEILHDSIADLGKKVPVDLAKAVRP
ncbi:MAG TPA: cytochrome c3 family protein [Hyphomicrobiales bacterium]|nr:cytochrome c3 family protein [Hyphomicrobiales bacterium]